MRDESLGGEGKAEEIDVLCPCQDTLNLQRHCPAAGQATFIFHTSI